MDSHDCFLESGIEQTGFRLGSGFFIVFDDLQWTNNSIFRESDRARGRFDENDQRNDSELLNVSSAEPLHFYIQEVRGNHSLQLDNWTQFLSCLELKIQSS